MTRLFKGHEKAVVEENKVNIYIADCFGNDGVRVKIPESYLPFLEYLASEEIIRYKEDCHKDIKEF